MPWYLSPYIAAIAISWAIAHVIKFAIAHAKGKVLDFTHQLFISGGMPRSPAPPSLSVRPLPSCLFFRFLDRFFNRFLELIIADGCACDRIHLRKILFLFELAGIRSDRFIGDLSLFLRSLALACAVALVLCLSFFVDPRMNDFCDRAVLDRQRDVRMADLFMLGAVRSKGAVLNARHIERRRLLRRCRILLRRRLFFVAAAGDNGPEREKKRNAKSKFLHIVSTILSRI